MKPRGSLFRRRAVPEPGRHGSGAASSSAQPVAAVAATAAEGEVASHEYRLIPLDNYHNLAKMQLFDEGDEQEHIEVAQYGVRGMAVLAAHLGRWADRFMPITTETLERFLDGKPEAPEAAQEPLALMDGDVEGDDDVEPSAEGKPAAKKRRKGPTSLCTLPKAILFAKTNIAKAEAQLGLVAACPKPRVNRSLVKAIDASIKELGYRVESLTGRELQVEEAYIPDKLNCKFCAPSSQHCPAS